MKRSTISIQNFLTGNLNDNFQVSPGFGASAGIPIQYYESQSKTAEELAGQSREINVDLGPVGLSTDRDTAGRVTSGFEFGPSVGLGVAVVNTHTVVSGGIIQGILDLFSSD